MRNGKPHCQNAQSEALCLQPLGWRCARWLGTRRRGTSHSITVRLRGRRMRQWCLKEVHKLLRNGEAHQQRRLQTEILTGPLAL